MSSKKSTNKIATLGPAQPHELTEAEEDGSDPGDIIRRDVAGAHIKLQIAYHMREILKLVGEDPEREGLLETPARVANMYFDELMAGYHTNPPVCKSFESPGSDQLVSLYNIPFASVCEHHIMPFVGIAHIGYIPQKRVVGVSKLARVVRYFAQRLQIQERLTNQVADYLIEELNPQGVIAVIKAQHFCMTMRGVHVHGTEMTTSAVRGVFLSTPSARSEFLDLMPKGSI